MTGIVQDLFGKHAIDPPRFIWYDNGGSMILVVEKSYLRAIGYNPKKITWQSEERVYLDHSVEQCGRLWELTCQLGFALQWDSAEHRYWRKEEEYNYKKSLLWNVKRIIKQRGGAL